MKLTEQQLRQIIGQVLLEDSSGPAALKGAATDVIAAINEENPVAFWNALSEIIEGMAGSLEHAPKIDKQERAKFINAVKPVWTLCNQLRNAYRNQGNMRREHASRLSELIEPFEPDQVNQVKNMVNVLDRMAFNEDFDGAFEEIAAARSALHGLISKMRGLR